MLPGVCQLKTLLILLLLIQISCTSKKMAHQIDDQELLAIQEPRWFKKNDDHSLKDPEGKPATHLFFDVAPDLSRDQRFANVIITTPEKSAHAYQLDIISGQRHYSHSYCAQNDVWKKESGSFNRPPFAIGYLPRMLDQQGTPQKVIIVSAKEKSKLLDVGYHRSRIVGAYIEQSCREGNCMGKDNWSSRLVLIGVEASDSAFNGSNDEENFKKLFDWDEIKAHLENIDGRSFVGDQPFPLVRIKTLFNFPDAYDYFKKNSVFLSEAETSKIQQGCHLLYDRLWKDVGEMRPEDLAAKSTKALNEKLMLYEELKKKQLPLGFAARFKKFTKAYADEMVTCGKFVYPGNINKNPEMFWFHAQMGIFYRLHKEGYFFDCRKKAWHKNVSNQQGELTFDLKRDIDSCTEKDLDIAMNYIPNFLKGLRDSQVFYRFVDYDNHEFGTHRKLYSWIKQSTRKYDCSKDPNTQILQGLEIFPADVKWNQRDVIDIEDEMKIIY